MDCAISNVNGTLMMEESLSVGLAAPRCLGPLATLMTEQRFLPRVATLDGVSTFLTNYCTARITVRRLSVG